jgi:hypothetical protein
MQWGMIPRFQPLVVSGGKAQSEQMFSRLPLKADFPISELTPRRQHAAIAALARRSSPLHFELLEERSEIRRDGTREGVVLVL